MTARKRNFIFCHRTWSTTAPCLSFAKAAGEARPPGKMRQAAAPAASSPKKAGQGFSAHVGAKAAQAAALQALHILRRAQPAPCVSRAQVSPARPLQVASSLFYEGIGHFDGARYEEALDARPSRLTR